MIDLRKAGEILRELGYDVVLGDGELTARKDDVLGVWTLYMDRSGRIRVVSTRPGDIPRGRRVKRDGRVFRVLREVQETTTVMTEIDALDELPATLEEVGRVFALPEDEGPQQRHGDVG